MKISRTVSYALQATIHLAQSESESPVPCSKLASEGGMPERFLLQILRSLVTHGILHSTRGVEGGYSLEKTPDKISLLEIIEAIDGPLNSKMTTGSNMPQSSSDRLRDALEGVAISARKQLEQVKLSSLLTSMPKSPREEPATK
jgi:Rrf2 family transcriptional regulator, cysteine metabolism repressor